MNEEKYTHTILITYDDGCLEVYKIDTTQEKVDKVLREFISFYSLDKTFSNVGVLSVQKNHIPFSKMRKLLIREYKESDENL